VARHTQREVSLVSWDPVIRREIDVDERGHFQQTNRPAEDAGLVSVGWEPGSKPGQPSDQREHVLLPPLNHSRARRGIAASVRIDEITVTSQKELGLVRLAEAGLGRRRCQCARQRTNRGSERVRDAASSEPRAPSLAAYARA
jgi:hypothetical protein